MAVERWEISLHQGVCEISLQAAGPPVLSLEKYLQLSTLMLAQARRPEVGAVLLLGPPGRFIFGMDINEIAGLTTPQAARGITRLVQESLSALEAAPKPLICAVDGYCLGGGLELALACHVILATPEARLGLPEIGLGTIPSFGGTQRLARALGRNRALWALITGETFSGRQAHDWGLVAQLADPEQLTGVARELAGRLARLSRPALEALLAAALCGLDAPLERGLDLESSVSARLTGGADLLEGLAAFREKRRPRFPSCQAEGEN